MKLLTPSQARELDRVAMDEMGISSETLMGNAGRRIADKALELVAKLPNPFILVLCGKGNNGGDGFAAASILFKNKINVKIHSIQSNNRIKSDSLNYYMNCVALGIPMTYGENLPEMNYPNLIIDGLIGTGFHGELKTEIVPWIEWINNAISKVLSIDIPSGLNGHSGMINPIAVRADSTVTIEAPKIGMIFRNGKDYSGDIHVADIGFPNYKLSGLNWETIDESLVQSLLKRPKVDSNKFSAGKVLIIAGSKGMTGAAILSTYGALRSGSGLTITTAPESLNDIFERSILEGMTLSLFDDGSGFLSTKHFEKILEKTNWADSVILGPGLGREEETQQLIKRLVVSIQKPLVLDADGLYPFANAIDELNMREFPLIITPHFGELSYLTGVNKNNIISTFPEFMTEFMSKFNHTALVKQVPSCTFNKKEVIVNSTGNPGLATGGTGDILSGIIASFIAQGMGLKTASAVASFIHGKASDNLISEKGYRGQIASDLFDQIPKIISSYEKF
ncbi:MAG: NAD(P)H-hydrate dehydratase [Candidatus Marinimicrobia bacterium]|nr:NAD(P)H-hydrate dehydratase [Candidatus Neomarinimicrobiota bacterium]